MLSWHFCSRCLRYIPISRSLPATVTLVSSQFDSMLLGLASWAGSTADCCLFFLPFFWLWCRREGCGAPLIRAVPGFCCSLSAYSKFLQAERPLTNLRHSRKLSPVLRPALMICCLWRNRMESGDVNSSLVLLGSVALCSEVSGTYTLI